MIVALARKLLIAWLARESVIPEGVAMRPAWRVELYG